MVRKLLYTASFLFILWAATSGIIAYHFGGALWQEGNPVPLLTAIYKLETSSDGYVLFAETDRGSRYISKDNHTPRYGIVQEFMKEKGWNFIEQEGSGLFFEKSGQTVIVGTRQYSRHYILWDIPNEA